MPEKVFELESVRVNYGFRTAVEDLSLKLEKGQALGLLGGNGAGKTSTIKVLMGLIRPRKGQVRILDGKPGSLPVLRRLSFAPEDGVPQEYLSGEEYLSFLACLRVSDKSKRKEAVRDLLSYFELAPEKKIRDYSKGMKRRLLLGSAFLGNPDLLILDEPLNGLDPLIIIKLRDKILEYRKSGGSLLFSSHILAEVERCCTDVAILKEGRLVCHESVENLKKEFGSVEDAFAKKVST